MANAAVNNTLEATSREATSKNAARRVRVSGQVPAVVYGAGKNSQTVSVDPRHVKRILYSETGHNTIVDLKLPDELTKAMIVTGSSSRSKARFFMWTSSASPWIR